MAARSPNEAVQAFLEPLRHALACVTEARLLAPFPTSYSVGHVYTTVLGKISVIPLQTSRLGLTVQHQFEILPMAGARNAFLVRLIKYIYSIRDRAGHSEISAFHYHPLEPSSPQSNPHMHLEAAMGIRRDEFRQGLHVPSGWVTLEAVLRFLLGELGVGTRTQEWRSVLADSEAALFAEGVYPTTVLPVGTPDAP